MSYKSDTSFWPSYSDLMTSLFFVMLLLFVLSFAVMNKVSTDLQKTRDSLYVKLEQYKKIQELDSALSKLDTNYFTWNAKCKRFELRQEHIFEPESAIINDRFKDELINAGRALSKFIDSLKNFQNINYVMILDGRVAKNNDIRRGGKYLMSEAGAMQLGYERSNAVKEFWKSENVHFSETTCEILIAGSGYGGSCRFEGSEEDFNKRVVIQIIPKIRR